MSVLPSLIAALERAAGDCLVLRSGERPHVVAGDVRHDVGTTTLSVKAVEALAAQILSPSGQKELAERASVQEVLSAAVPEGSLTARAERVGDELHVELRRHRRAPAAANPEPAAMPAPLAETPISTEVRADNVDTAPSAVEAEQPTANEPAAAQPQIIEPETPAITMPLLSTAAASPVVAETAQVQEPEPEPPAAEVLAPVMMPAMSSAPGPVPTPPVVLSTPAPFAPGPISTASAPSVIVSGRQASSDDLEELIDEAAERGATALYLRTGQMPAARIEDRLQPLVAPLVSATLLNQVSAAWAAGEDGWTPGAQGEWVREYDIAGAVRCYPFADAAGAGLVVHLSPRTSAVGLQRHVPRQVRRACEAEDGLVLVSAPEQADLLAMIAAVADLAARKRAGYVICLEPPNGLPSEIAGTFVSERRLSGSDEERTAAIRRAVQERPDLLVVGPMESSSAVEQVIMAATPGRLVIMGVVAPTALRAVESLLGALDREREPQLRRTFATAFRAAFSYRGLRRLGGGRTSVQDVLIGTNDVRARLERADFGGIEQLLRHGTDGMRTLDSALARAVARRQVSLRNAAGQATDRGELIALARKDARDRRHLSREQRTPDRRPGLRAITLA